MRVAKLATTLLVMGVGVSAIAMSGSSAVADLQNGSVNVLPVVLRDPSGLTALAIQLAPGRPDTGRFAFRIYGTGTVIGVVPLRETADECDFDSAITGTFYNDNGTNATSAQIRLSGKIDNKDRAVTVTLVTGSATYKVVIPITAPGNPFAAAQSVLRALQAEDWASLYPLLASDVKTGYSATQFAQAMATQSAPRVLSYSLTGTGGPRIVGGFAYFIVPYTAKLQASDGTVTTDNESVYLVLEGANWRFLTTGPTPP
jgi:hypothetical protein